MRILLIAGHGQGDPGATGNGYKEAELTRELVGKLKPLLSEYFTVDVYDTTKNMYKYLKSGKSFNFKNYSYVFEVHFNAYNGTANGTEVLVHTNEKGTSVEQLVVDNLAKLGFSNRGIKRRDNLLNMNTCKKVQGISYALLETCFIDNSDDMKRYVANKDAIAEAITKGIAVGFGVAAAKSGFDMALDKLVDAGLIVSPDYWRNAAKSVKYLDTLIINFANTL